METISGRAADPVYDRVLVPFDGSQLAAGAMPAARALAGRFGATVHTVTVAVSGFDLPRMRSEAASALGTDLDDTRIHVEVDSDVAAAVHRCASSLGGSLVCLSTHGRGRVAGVIGSTARAIIERGRAPVVVAGPFVVHPDADDETAAPPLAGDRLVACVDGTAASERVMPVAAAWAHTLGMRLTVVTVAEPSLPPARIGATWRRHHGPNEDADEYIRRLGERWALDAPGDTAVIYDPISVAAGMTDYLAAHPAGLVAVTSRLRDPLAHLAFGSAAGDIVHTSSAPVLVVPVPTKES